MNLEKSIVNAIDLSHRLEAALKVADMDLCRDILDIRGEAMDHFERWHRAGTVSEIQNCRELIEELITVDRELQDNYQTALDSSAEEYRQSKISGSKIPTGAYNTNITPACVDRKA